MNIDLSTPLLAGLSPAQFMRRHWQKKPLLVRGAIAGFKPPVGREALWQLAAQEDVESRLVRHGRQGWSLRRGPFDAGSLPSPRTPGWTLLVQGVDLHSEAVHALMQRFRFVPDARLDDVMISYATNGGGVGPHFDSYDVFLLQAHGRRRWRIGRQKQLDLVEGLPLKILAHFEPEEEYVLEPGDMLYLPPRWAHDGVAEGECMTYSIGFRQPARGELAQDLLQRMADEARDALGDTAYRDPRQPATGAPGAIPAAMHDFARDALQRLLKDDALLALTLGEALTDPKPEVWFPQGEPLGLGAATGVRLDRRTRMMHDARHIFINGEGFSASGRDARLMRRLADARQLSAANVARLSEEARELLDQWAQAGWLHADA
ncbi:cupin domain-containing protein [Comamonadaceae bacterium OH2545_COT-014]|nr:cupin domain-containing protein [Comamonadaceae bacterium OH2545_COT-014]